MVQVIEIFFYKSDITYFVLHSSFSLKQNQGNRKLFYQFMSLQPSTHLKQCEKKKKNLEVSGKETGIGQHFAL